MNIPSEPIKSTLPSVNPLCASKASVSLNKSLHVSSFFVILLAVISRADESYQRLEVVLEFSHNLPLLWNDAYFPGGISEDVLSSF